MDPARYDDFFVGLSSREASWTPAQESLLLEPFQYISSSPGKEFRGQLVDAFNQWLKVPEYKLNVIKRVVGLFHNASLLIDDIEDDSQLRRGMPVAHKIYGVPQTINTANYVYFLAYQELSVLRPPVRSHLLTSARSLEVDYEADPSEYTKSALRGTSSFVDHFIPDYDLDLVVNAELMSLHRGQGLDILWRDTLRCPEEDEYIDMVRDKTGGLLRIAIKLMMACATDNCSVNFVPLVDLLGIFFQIRDDYMNLESNQYSENKGFAEDLSEGKFSFPIVHGIRTKPSDRRILNILQKRPKSPTLKHHVIAYLRDTTKSFDYTLAVMQRLEDQARREIAKLGGNKRLEVIIDKLHVENPGGREE